MQELTDEPPENLRFGFSCGRLGEELERQIETLLQNSPDTRLIFIDTLQMIRDNIPLKGQCLCAGFKDLSALKRLADDRGVCTFVVHHTRKERDGKNIFNDMSGSTGIMGVADTCMILRKDERFGDTATLCINESYIEERKLKIWMNEVKLEVTEDLCAEDLRREKIPNFVFRTANYLLAHGRFEGTASELLAAVGETELKPNAAGKYLTRFYGDVLMPLGIHFDYRKTAAARVIRMNAEHVDDGNDDNDRNPGNGKLPSSNSDGKPTLPFLPS